MTLIDGQRREAVPHPNCDLSRGCLPDSGWLREWVSSDCRMLAWALPAPQARRVASRSGGTRPRGGDAHHGVLCGSAAFDLCFGTSWGCALRPAAPPPAVPASLVRPRLEPRYARHPAPRSVHRTVWLDPTTSSPGVRSVL